MADVITRAHAIPKGRVPIPNIPFKSLRRDDGGLTNGDDADVLREGIARNPAEGIGDVQRRLAHPDPVPHAALENEGQRIPGYQIHAAVSLAEALVHAAAEPAHAYDVPARRLLAGEIHGLGEVGGFLLSLTDDAAVRKVLAGLVGERVKIPYDGVEISLSGMT
ncbi:hypothetical protein RRF57_009420 [Xylaria bambusicola]|uniref:Uncharacterized protein n=1 Tax=Xylaria bambusicola TaxID=326684 RepID=A0AAN7UVI6_9PEZI